MMYKELVSVAVLGDIAKLKRLLATEANPNAAAENDVTVLYAADEGWLDAKTQEKAKAFKRVVEILREARAE